MSPEEKLIAFGGRQLPPKDADDDLGFVSPADFGDSAIEPLEWLVPDWIPKRRVTIFQGDGGLGKSTVLQQLQTSVATGCAWLGLAVIRTGASIGVYSEEEDRDLRRRQVLIDHAYAQQDRDHYPLMKWYPLQSRPLNKDFFTADQSSALFTIENGKPTLTGLFWKLHKAAYKLKVELVTLDVAVDLFDADEIRRREVRAFLRALSALARELNCAVVLSAHVSQAALRNDGGHSGSTDWSNGPRSRLYLSLPQSDDDVAVDYNARLLTRKKANDASVGDTIKLHWEDGLIIPDSPRTGYFKRPVEDVFLTLLDEHYAANRDPLSENARAGNFAPRRFAHLPARKRDDYREPDFRRAMESLFTDRKIVSVDYGRPDRLRKKIIRAGVEEAQPDA
jgi:RecA-family ATPase